MLRPDRTQSHSDCARAAQLFRIIMIKIETVGIHSPGEMGQVVGMVLKENGCRVVAALEGRSERTKGLANEAGIEDVGGLEGLVEAADLVLSILVPAQAVATAAAVGEAIKATKAQVLYADCNAISPQATGEAGAAIEAAGGNFVDAGIIGPPPRSALRAQGSLCSESDGPGQGSVSGSAYEP